MTGPAAASLDTSGLDATRLRALLAAPSGSPEAAGLRAAALPKGPLVPCAVLVPILLGGADSPPGVLLTKRMGHLTRHAGQVAFPGGRIDPEDADAEAAALREAQEEIGLDPARVEVVGRLADFVTGTGYVITPVIGLLRAGTDFAGLDLRLSPDEVEAVFALDLSVLLDPAAPQRRQAEVAGVAREFWFWPHADHCIWGATAAILVHVAERLRAGGL